MGWKRSVLAAGRAVEARFDLLRFRLKRRMGRLGPIEVLPYRGYGTPRALFMKGRVLEGKGVTRSSSTDTVGNNLRNMLRRFASDEIPFARIRARFGGQELEAVADAEGFFDLRFEHVAPPDPARAWHPVEVELLWPEEKGTSPSRATGSVLVPTGARFGVISDLDDTVLRSGVTSLLKMAWTTFLNNAHTRLPFEGVASFYHALQRGVGGEFNPIFYVSNGPWNLYDLLEDFLGVHGVPAGPLFLRDWSPTALRSVREHKLEAIRTLLKIYPELPFVLIGDSGENDPEIYHTAVREHPGRIRAIYIRDVTTKERGAAVHAIAREVRSLGIEMLLVPDTTAAAEHAAHEGFISPEALPGVCRESAGG
jgi:phosphatidate phosphatase APP1